MEKKIEIFENDNLESIVYTLLAARARGEQAYCNFNGHMLHSIDVSMDSAYIEVMGCTKEEYNKKQAEQLHEEYFQKENAREIIEQQYAEKIRNSRTNNKPITSEDVINGLKFIAEHKSISQEELIDELIALDCNFSLDDIKNQFPEEANSTDGIRNGKTASGALLIINFRDSEASRAYCNERFLSVDDENSVYHFIRVTTGDESYTKENIEKLSNKPEKHI